MEGPQMNNGDSDKKISFRDRLARDLRKLRNPEGKKGLKEEELKKLGMNLEDLDNLSEEELEKLRVETGGMDSEELEEPHRRARDLLKSEKDGKKSGKVYKEEKFSHLQDASEFREGKAVEETKKAVEEAEEKIRQLKEKLEKSIQGESKGRESRDSEIRDQKNREYWENVETKIKEGTKLMEDARIKYEIAEKEVVKVMDGLLENSGMSKEAVDEFRERILHCQGPIINIRRFYNPEQKALAKKCDIEKEKVKRGGVDFDLMRITHQLREINDSICFTREYQDEDKSMKKIFRELEKNVGSQVNTMVGSRQEIEKIFFDKISLGGMPKHQVKNLFEYGFDVSQWKDFVDRVYVSGTYGDKIANWFKKIK